MSKFDEELESSVQGQEAEFEEDTSKETAPVTDEGSEAAAKEQGVASPETVVTLLGRQYDLSKPDQVQELVKDYDRLGRQYAPLVQQLQELQERLNQLQSNQTPQQRADAQNITDPETLNYLRQLGFITKEEMNQILQQYREEEQLEAYLTSLEAEYDGSDGRPKFNRQEVLQFCVNNGIADPLAGYKLLYEKELNEWNLKNLAKGPTPPPVTKGTRGATMPKPKKITLNSPSSEEEVDLRTALETDLDLETPHMSD
jgi:vacuolar-type H+-ATPase subunit I/STV1